MAGETTVADVLRTMDEADNFDRWQVDDVWRMRKAMHANTLALLHLADTVAGARGDTPDITTVVAFHRRISQLEQDLAEARAEHARDISALRGELLDANRRCAGRYSEVGA